MKIYTRKGDGGETSLFGGQRVWKDNPRISAYGAVDELNSLLGVTVTEVKNQEVAEIIIGLQNNLFTVGSDLASPLEEENRNFSIPRVPRDYVEKIEKLIDDYDSKLPQLKKFIIPGGTKGAALLHLARTVCRRAERDVILLSKSEFINKEIKTFLNRLSDLLFVLARFENFSSNCPDIEWKQ